MDFFEIASIEHNENVTKIINFIKWFNVIKIKGVVLVSNGAVLFMKAHV